MVVDRPQGDDSFERMKEPKGCSNCKNWDKCYVGWCQYEPMPPTLDHILGLE